MYTVGVNRELVTEIRCSLDSQTVTATEKTTELQPTQRLLEEVEVKKSKQVCAVSVHIPAVGATSGCSLLRPGSQNLVPT